MLADSAGARSLEPRDLPSGHSVGLEAGARLAPVPLDIEGIKKLVMPGRGSMDYHARATRRRVRPGETGTWLRCGMACIMLLRKLDVKWTSAGASQVGVDLRCLPWAIFGGGRLWRSLVDRDAVPARVPCEESA